MYIGVDLGTSSLKISIADENGKILDSVNEGINLFNPLPNYYEENPNDWYQALINGLMKLKGHYDLTKVSAISFCGQMHGLVILDKKDEVIRNAILWNDSRTVEEVNYLNNVIGKDVLIKETSNIALCGFTLPKLLWVQKHEPNNFSLINKVMLPKDYLVYKMSGAFASDITDLSGTLFYSVEHNKYSKKMLEISGVDESKLPKIHNSYDVVGHIKEKIAKITGLSTSCKVVVGGGDQAVGATGTNTLKDGDVFVSLGTSGTVFASFDKYTCDLEARVHTFRHANNKFHYLACTLSASNSFTWWVNKILKKSDFDLIFNEIDVSNITDLIFLPYLCGERSPINDPDAKGAFFGLNDCFQTKDLTKAVVEGVCFSLLDNYKVLEELGINVETIKVIGGGSKSKKVLQILADIFGKKIQTISTSDGGSLGAIILAMKGDKPNKSLEEIGEKIVEVKEEIYPNLKLHEKYLSKFFKYKRLYFATKNIL